MSEAAANTVSEELIAADRPLSGRERMTGFALSFFGFVVVYCFLAGPMAGLHRIVEFSPFRRVIEVLYAPVVIVVENDIEPLATILKVWVSVFR